MPKPYSIDFRSRVIADVETHLLADAVARGDSRPVDPSAMMSSIPAVVWPPGVSITDFHFAGLPGGKVVDDVSETRLFKLAQQRGIKF